MTEIYSENWPQYLAISALISWGVVLTPPLVIRFLVLKRSLTRPASFLIVALIWFGSFLFFAVLRDLDGKGGNPSPSFLLFSSVAAYYILHAGSKKKPPTPTEEIFTSPS